MTHSTGTNDIQITQPGVYQANFYSTASTGADTPTPATLTVGLNVNNTPVTGAAVSKTFTTTDEMTNLSFSVPFQVTTTPTTVQVVPNDSGFEMTNTALNILRLGDAT